MADEKPKAPVLLPKNDACVDALAAWRRETARARGVSAYVVLPNATLLALAKENPTSIRELFAIPGMGPKRVEDYGLAILRVLRGARRRGASASRRKSARAPR